MDPIEDIVNERGKDYGHPSINHNRTARLYTAYLESTGRKEISAHDVCMLNILQKISRTLNGNPTEDTLQDIAGYALNAQIVEDSRS